MVKGWSGDGQERDGQERFVKDESSLQHGQGPVELQGPANRGRALVADLVAKETTATGKRAHFQALVKGRSARDTSGSYKSVTNPMTSLVGTMKHVSTPSRKIVLRRTMSRPCRGRVASVS
eukprot:6197210-Prymnesium_polylepis.1